MKRTVKNIIAGLMCTGISIFGVTDISAEVGTGEVGRPVPVIELENGETFPVPNSGKIEIADEKIVKNQEDGCLQALEEGETEVVVRWKVKVKNKDVIPEEPVNVENWIHEKEEQAVTEEFTDPETEQTELLKEEKISVELPDTQSPEICFENLSAFQSGEWSEHPVISFKDSKLNQRNIRILLEGELTGRNVPEVATEIKEGEIRMTFLSSLADDAYTLVCTAWDDYGNLTEKKWLFTVNKNGTIFRFDKEKKLVTSVFDPEIAVESIDAIEIVSCMVNGENVSYEWEKGKIKIPGENLKKGKNRISLTVRDAEGKVSEMEPWDFYVEPENRQEGEESSEENTDSSRTENVEEKKGEETELIKKQQESPIGIIFLLIGSIAVFWEKKICYNDHK
ncbi:MAG: hypothetical protein ACI4EO_09395 [Blautia sp.]